MEKIKANEKNSLFELCWSKVIMVYGNLASLWGLDEQLSLSREQIRSGQELGINILHYAWRWRYFTQLQY